VLRSILLATAVAGTLDLCAAFILSGMAGVGPIAVLQFVASGPFGEVMNSSPAFASLGLLVHYGIMFCMAGVYMAAAARLPALNRLPALSGIAYGLVLWFVMYWIVRPMRWETIPPPSDPKAIAGQLFCHLILVGVPIALIAARRGRPARIATAT
jgi:hypothetical protein